MTNEKPGELMILIVDDNAINLLVLEAMISKLGHQCHKASSAKEAISLFEGQSYDMVLTDITMPGMDGFEAAKRMRELEEAGRQRTRIYAVTASRIDKIQEHCESAGLDGYFTKPLAIESLAFVCKDVGIN